MESFFDTLIATCREIIKEQELPLQEKTEQPQPRAQQEVAAEEQREGEKSSDQQQQWRQFENAITKHIKMKNSKATDPIILIEESSEEQHPKASTPESSCSKDPEETQGESEAKESQMASKPPLRIVCKAAEPKEAGSVPRWKSAAQSRKLLQLNKKAELNREVRCKVNIQELKEKIIQPARQAEDITKQTNPPLKSAIYPPMSKKVPAEQTSTLPNAFRNAKQTWDCISSEGGNGSSRGKVAKKGGKGKGEKGVEPEKGEKPAVSPEVQQIVQRRQEGRQVDLGVLSLDEVVAHCHNKKLISEEFYIEHIATSSEENIGHFIELFIKNELKSWDFRHHKITIMDHRRLAQYLVRIFPQEFKICRPDNVNHSIKDFLENLYGLPPEQYKKLLESLDAASKVTEWKTMRTKFQKYDKVPVNILPAPISTTQGKTPLRRPIPVQLQSQTIKKVPIPKPFEKERKRTLSSVYEDEQAQVNEHEMRLISLKNQLKKKKVG